MKNFSRLPCLLGVICVLFTTTYTLNVYNGSRYLLTLNLFKTQGVGFSVGVVADGVSLRFLSVVTLISCCVFLFANRYMSTDINQYRFGWILLSFVLAICFLITSGSFFTLILGWDGLGLTSFALIIFYENREAGRAGFLTLMINRIGDVIILASFSLFIVDGLSIHYPPAVVVGGLVPYFCMAAITKRAQYPFCAWLPAAMAAPTPVRALVHSSTLVTAGVFLLVRLTLNGLMETHSARLCLYLGRITCFLGGAAAIWECDLKKIIALSTLSQLGVIIYRLGLNLPTLTLLHLYAHAMFKALLFLVAGLLLMQRFGTQDIRMLRGLVLRRPRLIRLINIGNLCLLGFPFIRAFYSKHLILEKMLECSANGVTLVFFLLGTIGTGIYTFRLFKILTCSPISPGPVAFSITHPSRLVPLLPLGLMAIIRGSLFSHLDLNLFEISWSTAHYHRMLSFMLMISMVLGLTLDLNRAPMMVTSLFFLTPTSYNTLKLFSGCIRSAKRLELSLLEPAWLFRGRVDALVSYVRQRSI